MPLHPEVARQLAAAIGTPDHELPITEARRRALLAAELEWRAAEQVAGVEELVLELPGRRIVARRYDPLWRAAGPGLLVYYHGGGFANGSVAAYDARLRRLANRTGWKVLAIDYRLAPEDPFPAAVEDAEAAFAWAVELADGRPVVLAGDSAGGNLAAVVSRRRRDAGLTGPAGQVLLYPVMDLGPGPECFAYRSYLECASGYGLTDAHMRWYRSMYLGDRDDFEVADVSPLRDRRFDGLPPTLVITAEYDVLRDEAELYAERLRIAGVAVVLRRFDGHVHGFAADPRLADSDRALDLVRSLLESMDR